MPTNLLTGEVKATEKKPVNLLPELTGLNRDSDGGVILPEVSPREPMIKDYWNTLNAGLSGLWATASRIPAGIYDIAALPQNMLVKAFGRGDLQVKSPEWLMDNPIAELYDYQMEAFDKEIGPIKSFEEAFKTKDFDGLGRTIALGVVRNAPQQIGLILSYMAGYPSVGVAGMGLLETASSLKEGRKLKEDPAMNAYNSMTKGVIEAGFESIGTMGILKNWSNVLRKGFGTMNAKQIVGAMFKTVFHSILGEGNEEWWTSLAQDFSDFVLGRKKSMKGSLARATEAGAIGAVSGGLMTGPGAIGVGHRSASLAKMQEDVNKVAKVLQEERIDETLVEEVEEPEKVAPAKPEVAKKPIVEGKPKAEGKARPVMLAKQVQAMEDRKARVEAAKSALDEIEDIYNNFKRRITRFRGDFMKEELSVLPKEFVTEEGGIKPDEVIDELNEKYGAELNTVDELAEYLRDIAESRKTLLAEIKKEKPKFITQREDVRLKQRVKDIERGIKEGRTITKAEIKNLQEGVIQLIDTSDLIPADKAKFIKTIKNIQTQAQLEKAMPDLVTRMAKLEVSAEKRKIGKQIKKELKKTKPVKQGQRRVAKYDYESNKLFEDLRVYQGLSQDQAQAELDAFPETGTEADLIRKRFLSLRASGKQASSEIFRQVLADIKEMKKIGEAVKSELAFEKQIERQENVNTALAGLKKVRGSKKTIIGKITNLYRKGFSNMYSMYNSIFGKAFAEKNDPILAESQRSTAIFQKTKVVSDEVARIYEKKTVWEALEGLLHAKYDITDFDGLTKEITKLELIDIYNSLKNDKKKADYYEFFGEEQVTNLMGHLLPQDKAFGDFMQETAQEYREIFNKHHIERTGRDLGFVENYWMATSEYKDNVFDDIRIQGETPAAEKERAKGKVVPKPGNAWLKLQKHIAQGEHVQHLSRKHEQLKRLFTDRKVKHAVEEKYGEDVYRVLMVQLDNISLNAHVTKIDAVSEAFRIAIDNWVTSKIALNPSTLVRQLMSQGNFIEDMPADQWVKLYFEGIKSPKETFNFMWDNAKFLEARFNRGHTEAIADALRETAKLNRHFGNWHKFLSIYARSGDITAIIYGGYPLLKSELAKGKSMEEAVEVFEKATLRAQQSSLSSSLSQFQNSRNPFARLFLAFKNTSNQYLRKMADAAISYGNGDISRQQFIKTMAIYGVIQPTLYTLSGIAVKEGMKALGRAIGARDDEEEDIVEKTIDAIMVQLVVNPVNAIPVIGDAVEFGMRKLTGQKAYKVISTPFIDDLATGISKFFKQEVTAMDYLKGVGSILEPVVAAPAGVFIRLYEYLTGKGKKGKVKFK